MFDAGDLGARLRRLRREERPAAAGAAPLQAPSLPSESLHTSAPSTCASNTSANAPRTPALPRELVRRLARAHAAAPPVGRTTIGAPAALEHSGAIFARRTTFALEHVHGRVCLGDVLSADAACVARVAKDERLAAFDATSALFLDIEATGLSGGSGTYPFLVALGAFVEREGSRVFELWQGFMPSPGDEAALLEHVAQRLRGARTLVTFFGKSYDRHRLEDKMRHHRIPPPFAALPHLDLFHPLQRLYKGALANGRLATYERELCGVERTDDLSGAHAPAAWFDFVAGRPHRLEDVFRHNADDVLSLVTLAAHLGACERVTTSSPLAAMRARALARVAAEARRHTQACAAFEHALELGATLDERLVLLWARALEQAAIEELAANDFEVARARHERLVGLAGQATTLGPSGAAAIERLALRLGRRLAARHTGPSRYPPAP
jgi:uncharacterized protein YprB with RNaseH-like and TPR domain